MSIEFFCRGLSVFPLLDPRPPAASTPSSIANYVIKKVLRGSRPMLHIPPMTQLAWPGEHEIPIVGEIDCRARCGF
jgi:hypothetical protein